MATILITLRYGFAARTVLRTGILASLRQAGHRLVLICPAAGEAYLAAEVGPDVALEPYPRPRPGAAEAAFAALADALLFDHPGTTRTMTIKWWQLLAERRRLSWVGKGAAALPQLHRSRTLRHWIEALDRRAFRHEAVGALLRRHVPDLLVTTDLFSSEAHFVREARRRDIPSVCLVKSWDNLTSKGRIRVHPDYLVVWSDLMRDEAVRLHFFPAERIVVAGAANFDLFRRVEFPRQPREAFLRGIGAAPEARLVVYSPGHKFTFSDEENILRLSRILRGGTLGVPAHLHVRKYPKAPQDFSRVLGPGVTVEEAGIEIPSWDDRVDQPYAQMLHLGELMAHTDVLIHLGSTIAIDAACFDKPVIGYALDSTERRLPRSHYGRRVFSLTHNQYLVDSGGMRVVRTEAELIEILRTYLQHPERDRDGRRQMVERLCWRIDGQAGERIAAFLLGLVAGGPVPAVGPLPPTALPRGRNVAVRAVGIEAEPDRDAS